MRGKFWRAVFECQVAVGRTYETEEDWNVDDGSMPDELPPRGFDSVSGVPGRHLNYPETVVYDERACVPSFLVIYSLGRTQ